jgi:hypothetical protein
MKKLLVLALVLVLSTSVIAGAMADTLGLGVVTGIGSSKAATADKDGAGQVDTAICTVMVDDKGVITAVLFDVAQTKVSFNAKGEITADLAGEFPSKYEKKDAYNMKAASPIGKEWYEQADALVAFCTGKTLEQVLAGVSEDKNSAVAEDLKAGATIHLADLIIALEKAYTQATAK